jgi:hypothetical protein
MAGKKDGKSSGKGPEIILGVLTLIGVIITALLAFPPIIHYFERIMATPTVLPSPTVFFSPTLLPSATQVVTPTLTPAPTTETPFTTSPSPEPPGAKMIVRLQANMTSGKAPLLVSFDACNSNLESSDGSTWGCSPNLLCTYTWAVYRDGKQIGNPVQGQGKYSYKFTQKGTYFVTVYVCRGDVCGGNGITIVAK